MKRLPLVAIVGTLAAMLCGPFTHAQNAPLGDYARQARKQKTQQPPAAKTFDNDNLPRVDKLSVVGQPPAETTDASAADKTSADAKANPPLEEADAAKQPAGEKKPTPDDPSEKQKVFKDWQKKIQDQRSKVDLLSRELDVANREYRLRAAAFYADAGNRLRNAQAWDKEDATYKEQITAKQQKLDDAKKELEDLQERAHRAGVPSSLTE